MCGQCIEINIEYVNTIVKRKCKAIAGVAGGVFSFNNGATTAESLVY